MLGTGTQACPMDWDRISTIKLTQREHLRNRHFNECKRGTAKGKAIIINIDRFALVHKRFQLIPQMEAVKDC
jgi:hypothetical protein